MRSEVKWLVLLLAAFLLVNGLTLSRFPSVWVDEIQFADPAVRMASGMGFTSAAWFAQDSSRFWAGNVPLYSALLGGWLSLLGPGMVAERWLNLILFVIFLVLVWLWMIRSQVVRNSMWRLAALGLLVCGHAMVFSYRSGRYDVLGMLLAAGVANLWIEEDSRWRWPGLFCAGMLLPATGLQLLPAMLAACGLMWVAYGVGAIRRSAILLGGCTAGWLGLFEIYRVQGVWSDFQASTRAVGLIGQSLTSKLAGLPAVYLTDKSRCLVLLATVVTYFAARKSAPLEARTLRLTWIATLGIPAALHLAGKFPIYYGWMVYVPLSVAGAGLMAAGWPRMSGLARVAAMVLLAAACGVGLPLRMASIATQWSARGPEPVEAFVRTHVKPQDKVLADFKLYFPLALAGNQPLLPTYVHAMNAAEKASVSVLMLRQEDAATARMVLGGSWEAVGSPLPPPKTPGWMCRLAAELREEQYPVTVYRKTADVRR